MTDIATLIDKMKITYPRQITLHSGGRSYVKYDIDLLTDDDLRSLARAFTSISNIDGVVSVGGGNVFGCAISLHYCINFYNKDDSNDMRRLKADKPKRLLAVDDVATTGNSLKDLEKLGNIVCALVIVKRGPIVDLDYPLLFLYEDDVEGLQ